ncbi:hypothetical protein OAM55_01660, partial [Flavobacteriaceae bacterium]|nr:hypothetical protein [Flavobacteriaceae bacterium]
LTSLAGTVSSLASTVNGLGDTIDTAVADGLTDIQADIDAIEAAVADVASSEEVSALSDAVAASQDDLDQLLANSSVYQNSILINSVATLDVYYSMGSAINIVNGSVTITVSEDMDMEKVQAVVDNILVTLNDFTYTSGASTIAEVTFQNLTGTSSLTVEQAGGYDFRNLQSATNIVLGDAYKSTIGVIHFGALTSVASFATEATANTISFSKATELHLTALPYYTPGALTLLVDTGSVIDITALDDVDSSGDQADLNLSITGPSTITLSNIEDGDITLADVATATVNGFLGAIIIGEDVESFTADSVVESITLTAATDLETLTITGVVDADDDDSVGPAIAITSANDNLETLTVSGDVASLSVSGASKLVTAVVSADVDGTITFSDNDDLETLTLTDSEADAVVFTGNDSIETLTIDTTNSADDGSLTVTDNTDLESLTVSYDAVETLKITGNTSLATVELSGITTLGDTEAPEVAIFNNDLTATSAVDEEDTTATDDGAASTDLGEFTTTSGLDTLATYLALVAAETTTASATVWFDTVESYTDESEDEDTDLTYANGDAGAKVLIMSANSADAGSDATFAKRSFIIDADTSAGTDLDIWVNDTKITGSTALAIDNTGNPSVLASSAYLLNADLLATATAAGVTVTATPYAGNDISVELAIGPNTSASENSATAVSSAIGSFVYNVSDTFAIALGSDIALTVTSTGATATSATGLANAIITEYLRLYPSGSATQQNWTVSTRTGVSGDYGTDHVIVAFDSKGKGSRDIGKELTATHTAGKTATYSNVGIKIGNPESRTNETSDNIARGSDVMITFTSLVAGSSTSNIGGPAEALGAGLVSMTALAVTATELTSTLLTNVEYATATTANTYPTEDRADVVNPESGVDAATDNSEFFTRVHWLD